MSGTRTERARKGLARGLLVVAVVVAAGGGYWLQQSRPGRVPVVANITRVSEGEVVELVSGDVDPGGLSEVLGAQGRPDVMVRDGDAWFLTRTLVVRPGAEFDVEGEQLRLLSEGRRLVGLEARGGNVNIRSSLVTSWDRRAGGPDTQVADGRAWVLARDAARMDVLDSRLELLGYDEPERYGVAWRTPGTGGEVRTSTFSGNFYGAYTYDSAPMHIWESVFERSHRYGLDPNTNSRGFLIENNEFRENGSHGLLLAVGSSQAVVRNNRAHRNGENGIVVFAGSDDVVVQGNEVHDNRLAGIDINRSARTLLTDNTVYANELGVAVHDDAEGTRVERNRVTANRVDGLRASTGASLGSMRDNLMDFNYRAAIFLDDATATVGPRNELVENLTGVRISAIAGRSAVLDNTIVDNVEDGVHLTAAPPIDIRGNQITGNGNSGFSVSVGGNAGPFLGRNIVAENNEGPQRVRTE